MKGSGSTIAVRVSGELLAAIDAEVQRQRAARPGVNMRRSDLLRELLIRQFLAAGSHPSAGGRASRRKTASR